MNRQISNMLMAVQMKAEDASTVYKASYIGDDSELELAALISIRDVCMVAKLLLPLLDREIEKVLKVVK